MIIKSCPLDMAVNAKSEINTPFVYLNVAIKTKLLGCTVKRKIPSVIISHDD